MVSEKLLPCPNPWCEEGEPLVERTVRYRGDASPRHVECSCGIRGPMGATDAEAIAAWNTRAPAEKTGWQPIETAPASKGDYFFARIAWGPEDDICTGDGFRWRGRWFVSAFFHKPGGGYDACQYEYRQIEVTPSHWCHKPAPPATTRAPADLRLALEAETIERKALHEILRVRPPGDVETCKVPRKLVEQMERIAMAALAPTKEPAA